MVEEICAVKKFLESKGLLVHQIWLESCVNWYKQEIKNNYSLDDLQSQVYEQWLLLDLCDVQVPVLPANIKLEKKVVLNKIIFLQLLSVVDISKPKLTQINNIRNKVAMSNTSEENMVSGNRVLQLTLTDGVQEILATEYKPIPFLNLNLTPGLKIRLNPPITVRRGQIMLEPANIKLLGGNVADIIVSNAAENVLAKALGLPLTEKPVVMQEFDYQNQTQDTQMNQNNHNTNLQNSHESHNQNEVRDNYSLQSTVPIQSKSTSNAKQKQSNNISDNIVDDDDFDFDFDKIDDLVSNTDSKNLASSLESTKNTISTRSNIEDLVDPDDLEMLMEFETLPVSPVIKKPILTIDKILKMKDNVNKGKFIIFGSFKSVIRTLSVSNEKFSMLICIEDGSGEMNVNLDSEVISNLLGCDLQTFGSLKNNINNSGSSIPQMLQEFMDKLINLSSKMEILIESGKNDPLVLKLI